MKKVLVVDDDEAILEAVSIVLESEGYDVKTILDGEQTFKVVDEYQPDLILLDLLLSGREGNEIASDLREQENAKTIPIVIISAHPNARETAKNSGVDGF